MKCLSSIRFPRNGTIVNYLNEISGIAYPHIVFVDRGLSTLYFNNVTLLYGNNGSGKTTILNVIAEKIGAHRREPLFKDKKTVYSGTCVPFEDFLQDVDVTLGVDEQGVPISIPENKHFITSGDVFASLANKVQKNMFAQSQIDKARDDYYLIKNNPVRLRSKADHDAFAQYVTTSRKSAARYIRENSQRKMRMFYNGETALDFYQDSFVQGGLYLLDEPENCLSPAFQEELIGIILESVRYFDCQFIIATHSPLILAINGAAIYDLDSNPVEESKWEDLPNVRAYFDFFYRNKGKFGIE